jgi:thiamine kinase-like enzyme
MFMLNNLQKRNAVLNTKGGFFLLSLLFNHICNAMDISLFQDAFVLITHEKITKDNLIPLSGGWTSSQVFKVSLKQKDYVVRLLKEHDSLFNREQEIIAYKIASNLGIAPFLHYTDPEARFFITDYIEGRPLSREDLKSPETIKKIGSMIRLLHKHPAEGFQREHPQSKRVKKHYERAKNTRNIAHPSCLKGVYEDYQLRSKELEDFSHVLSHSDLNANNILIGQDGHLWFVDFTGASFDHQFADLGYFSFVNGLSEDQDSALLSEYFERSPTSTELALFRESKYRTSFITSIVWFDFSESKEDKLIPVEERIKRCDEDLADPKLISGEDLVKNDAVISPASKPSLVRAQALSFLKTYLDKKRESQ